MMGSNSSSLLPSFKIQSHQYHHHERKKGNSNTSVTAGHLSVMRRISTSRKGARLSAGTRTACLNCKCWATGTGRAYSKATYVAARAALRATSRSTEHCMCRSHGASRVCVCTVNINYNKQICCGDVKQNPGPPSVLSSGISALSTISRNQRSFR